MLIEKIGDLLECDADLLCHQTNYFGVMGGGIAASIYARALSKDSYAVYQKTCNENRRSLLGSIQILPYEDCDGRYIVNIFSQDDLNPRANGCTTDYSALRDCLQQVERYAFANRLTVALPGYIGCGIAGGDWRCVYQIIREVFENSLVLCSIVYWDAFENKLWPGGTATH